jgi:mRNA-degrading endonuclease RelE of RelBE toxin-antitoxin system
MKELIQIELDNDNPDWLKISKMAEKMYILGNKRHDFLGIRENMFNLVKVSERNINEVYDILVNAYPNTSVLLVGGYGRNRKNLNVPQAVKELKKIESGIIVSCKDAFTKHLSDKPYMKFNSNIKSNLYKIKQNDYTFVWKNLEAGETVEFTPGTLVSLMRDYKLNSLL